MSPTEAPTALESLEHRLHVLEARHRWLTVIAGGLLAFAAGTLLLGLTSSAAQPAHAREFTTQRLVINGPDNQPRAMLTGTEDGSSFFLYGPDKYQDVPSRGGSGGANPAGGVGGMVSLAPRLRFKVTLEGSKVEFLDPGGKERMILTLTADGPAIKMLDAEGNEIKD